MTKVCKFLLISILTIPSLLFAQTDEKESPFSFNATYIGDFVGNAGGGVKDAGGYLGYGSLGVIFSTEKAGWWKGGEMVLSGASIHGSTPTESWIGDFQVVDNIEGGNYALLQSLYYSQNIGNV